MANDLLHTISITARGVDTPAHWCVFIAGIYGAGRNWGAVARRLVEARPEWGVVMADKRGHGQSPAMEPPHTLDAVAEDIDRRLETLGIEPEAILGHSFGGKVSLTFARDPSRHVHQVWVVDSTPDTSEPSGSAWDMLDVLRGHPGPFPDRAAGIAAVESAGYANSVAQWMSTNLLFSDDHGGYVWRLDPNLMEELLQNFYSTDRWDIVEAVSGPELHFLRATRSSILSNEAAARIEAAPGYGDRVFLHPVEGGHWLNSDNPERLHELLVEWL